MACLHTFALLLQLAPAAWSARVPSPSGRFVAELRASGAEPERGESLRLTVFDERVPGDRQELWTGLVPHELAPGARALDVLSDDGAAFVRLVALPQSGVLVREVLKGTHCAQLRADDLGLAEEGAGAPWIDLATGLRWRPDDAGLNAHWFIDLLGVDGVVRTLDLDRGALHVHADETRGAPLEVQPPVPEPVRPATRETYVDDFEFPPLLYAGTVLEVEGHGHVPSAGWRFIGFDVLGDPRSRGKLVLSPRAVAPLKAAAQIVERHLWTARVRGLPPGTFEVEVCGAETLASDPRRDALQRKDRAVARTVEIVSPHQIVELRRLDAAPGEIARVALFDDGRLEIARGGHARVELATLAEWEHIESRVLALTARSSTFVELAAAHAVISWRTPARPQRVALNLSAGAAPGGALREIAELLERCARRFEVGPPAGK